MGQRVSLREVNRHLARYVKAAELGERIIITRRGKPVAVLSPLPQQARSLSPAQEVALKRLLSASHSLGGTTPSRDEMHEKVVPYAYDPEKALRALRGSVIRYTDPLEPVGLEDWGSLR